MAGKSLVSADLIRVYRAASYRVLNGRRGFTFGVGKKSAELARLYEVTGRKSAAFITACNPLGVPAAAARNAKAQADLQKELLKSACWVLSGFGEDAQGLWRREPSFLALGLSRAQAAALGSAYRQNAVLWAGPGAVPRLLLLR